MGRTHTEALDHSRQHVFWRSGQGAYVAHEPRGHWRLSAPSWWEVSVVLNRFPEELTSLSIFNDSGWRPSLGLTVEALEEFPGSPVTSASGSHSSPLLPWPVQCSDAPLPQERPNSHDLHLWLTIKFLPPPPEEAKLPQKASEANIPKIITSHVCKRRRVGWWVECSRTGGYRTGAEPGSKCLPTVWPRVNDSTPSASVSSSGAWSVAMEPLGLTVEGLSRGPDGVAASLLPSGDQLAMSILLTQSFPF